VPTTKPRHTITETDPVREALDELRSVQGGERIEFPDLVIRGARDKVRELRAESGSARRARQEIAEGIRTGEGPRVDVAAADEVKRLGLVANYDP
jgi:hypothetical protein